VHRRTGAAKGKRIFEKIQISLDINHGRHSAPPFPCLLAAGRFMKNAPLL
jgi:hypothetical protein